MKSIKLTVVLLMIAALVFSAIPALSEAPASFSFRNGITFGMSAEQLKQAEMQYNQIAPESWTVDRLNHWNMIGTNQVKVSKYKATTLMYFLSDDQMEIAAYDFEPNATEEMYNDLMKAYSAVYFTNEPVTAEEVIKLMDYISPGYYTEKNISNAVAWKRENVMIYQFCYGPSSFVIMYVNPALDYDAPDLTGI